jgi:GWxTD domain-containing protein
MMNRVLMGFVCLFCLTAHAQVLREINYNYQYDPSAVFVLNWKVVKSDNDFQVFYEVQLNDTIQKLDFAIELETRSSLSDKSGKSITVPAVKQLTKLIGAANFQPEQDQNIIVAKIIVTDHGKSKTFIFHKQLPKNKSPYLLVDQRPLLNSFINSNKAVSGFNSNHPLQISYYKGQFPQGAPAFSNAQAKVSKTLKPDSVFSIEGGAPIQFHKKGLYLAQQDTASAEGCAFRVEDDYPKLGKLESLAGPLIYICTKQETEKIKQAGNDKKKFDQIILSITGNSDRARAFMRSYFRRVELVNQYFSSYKEGWKTDRGMIYLIFGLPEEVYLFDDREVWEYKNDNAKIRFQFIKSPTLFDPNNYVLIRDKKFTNTWYEMIDLWRKARF